MLFRSLCPVVGFFSTALATHLYVSSYIGTITTLDLSLNNGAYELKTLAVSHAAPQNTSWLVLDKSKEVIYCIEEGLDISTSYVSSYKVSSSGVLTQIDRHSTIVGTVHQALYNGGKALAVAHYAGSSITTWKTLSHGGVSPMQAFTFTMSAPGPNPSRQEAPHPHEAVVDPTDSYVVFNDLGADLVRVFCINKATSELTELTPFKAPPGSGPRHGAFLAAHGKVYYFLVFELINTVKSYVVNYEASGLTFTEVFSSGIYGNKPAPAGAAAAEAVVSPDGNYLLTSSRNDSLFQIPDFDVPYKTIPSDTLQAWAIDKGTGKLTFKQLAPAGGMIPRQFSLDENGALAAVGLQNDGRVVIIDRTTAGAFGNFLAHIGVPGQITSVIWDEPCE